MRCTADASHPVPSTHESRDNGATEQPRVCHGLMQVAPARCTCACTCICTSAYTCACPCEALCNTMSSHTHSHIVARTRRVGEDGPRMKGQGRHPISRRLALEHTPSHSTGIASQDSIHPRPKRPRYLPKMATIPTENATTAQADQRADQTILNGVSSYLRISSRLSAE